MTEKSFQGRYIIWRTKKGAIDILLITVFAAMLLIIPIFRFFIGVFFTLNTIDKAKEVLEIAMISTYTRLNQQSLGIGILNIDETSAESLFLDQITELISGDSSLNGLQYADMNIVETEQGISINSKATIFSAFHQPIKVGNTVKFVIDPIMEGT